MKKIYLLIISLICTLNIYAQHDRGGKEFSPERFRQEEEAFITQKACLSQSEANDFFPLFREYKKKEKAYYDKMKALYKKGKNKNLDDKDYNKIINECTTIELSISRLKMQYMKKFQRVLSGKDLYKAIDADNKFHRNMLKGAMTHQKH